MLHVKRTTLVALTLVVGISCGAGPAREGEPRVAAIRSPLTAVEPREYSGVAWPSKDRLVVTGPAGTTERAVIGGHDLWVVDRQEESLRRVLGDDERCTRLDYFSPRRISEGRVAVFVSCLMGVEEEEFTIQAVDISASRAEILAHLPQQIGTFSWSPTLRRGIVSSGGGVCSGVAFLTPRGVRPLRIHVGEGSRRFRIDRDFFRRQDQRGCREYGIADWPTWSDSGNRIAFAASTQSVGREGWAKADAPSDLYIADPDLLEPTVVVRDVVQTRDLQLSPDGQSLAFSGRRGNEYGSWVLDIEDQTLRLISSRPSSWLAWAPDGGSIAALEHLEDSPVGPTQLVLLQLRH